MSWSDKENNVVVCFKRRKRRLRYQVRNPVGADIYHRGCVYTVLQTVQRRGVYSTAYGYVHYRGTLKLFEIRGYYYYLIYIKIYIFYYYLIILFSLIIRFILDATTATFLVLKILLTATEYFIYSKTVRYLLGEPFFFPVSHAKI